jgi:hypothetical protein
MNYFISRLAVLASLMTNLVILANILSRDSGFRSEYASLHGRELIAPVVLNIGLVALLGLPWLLALSTRNAEETARGVFFAVLSIASVLWLFVPPNPSPEAFGFYLLAHIGIVWLVYAFCFLTRRKQNAE